jgi:UDP-4-amino-4,6-dideoxy-N-acetyl-beta-L-altrosamine N-acetyltransferase
MMDIELVPLTEEDLERVRAWRNLPEVSQYMYTEDEISKEQQENWFRKIQQEENSKYWVIKYGDEKLGVANLADIDKRNSKCYWGFYLGNSNLRGKGIGAKVEYNVLQYVFDELKLNKLCGEVFSFNEKVVAMHEKFGFRREGYLRNHIYKNNKYHDVVVIGLLSSEWNQLKVGLQTKIYG